MNERRLVVHPRFEHLRPSLERIETFFDASAQSIHKARNELRIVELEGAQCVVKAFKVPNVLNRVIYGFFRHSKAYNSYHNAMALEALDIATPHPIAFIEERYYGLFGKSYFIALYEPYDFTIREALHHKIDDFEAVIDAFVDFTHTLHVKGVWHEDYSPGNILIRREESGYRFMLVDINRMRFETVGVEQGCSNFAKLWAREEDLERMASRYAGLCGADVASVGQWMRDAAQQVVRTKQFKKRLKGK